MSYIRSNSNPEGLYIVDTGKTVEIMRPEKDTVLMPNKVFKSLLKKSYNYIIYDGLPDWETEILSEDETASFIYQKFEGEFKMVLEFDNWKIGMWMSTWYFLVMKNSYRWTK